MKGVQNKDLGWKVVGKYSIKKVFNDDKTSTPKFNEEKHRKSLHAEMKNFRGNYGKKNKNKIILNRRNVY